MTVEEIIEEIKCSMGTLAVKEQKKVVNMILRSQKVFFLDTCFISKTMHIKDMDLILRAFSKMAGGTESDKIVFVITDLVLYELKDSVNNTLQSKNADYLQKLQDYGFTVLLLNEEELVNEISCYISLSNAEWNSIFVSWLHETIALLTYLSKAIEKNTEFPYPDILDVNYEAPSDESLIIDSIKNIKSQKQGKDSLAEELVCICIFFLFEVSYIRSVSEYCFCSADLAAITRLKKAVNVHSRKLTVNTMQVYSLLKYMIDEKIITEKEEAIDIMSNICGGGRIRAIIYRESPYNSECVELTPAEVAETMFAGINITFTGK